MKKGYSDDIKKLQAYIKRLQEIKDVLYAVEEVALEVERGVSEIDARIPLRETLGEIRDGEQRAQAEHALDLLEETFALIDARSPASLSARRWTPSPAAPVPARSSWRTSSATTNPAAKARSADPRAALHHEKNTFRDGRRFPVLDLRRAADL